MTSTSSHSPTSCMGRDHSLSMFPQLSSTLVSVASPHLPSLLPVKLASFSTTILPLAPDPTPASPFKEFPSRNPLSSSTPVPTPLLRPVWSSGTMCTKLPSHQHLKHQARAQHSQGTLPTCFISSIHTIPPHVEPVASCGIRMQTPLSLPLLVLGLFLRSLCACVLPSLPEHKCQHFPLAVMMQFSPWVQWRGHISAVMARFMRLPSPGGTAQHQVPPTLSV